MAWEGILKNDVEKIKQSIINHFSLQGADLGNVLAAISGMKHPDMIEIIEVSGLDANNPSSRQPFMQATAELKEGKIPSQSNVRVDPKTKIPWKAPSSDPTAISQEEVDNARSKGPSYARIREGRGE
jgi:hypothetical protein